MPNKPRFESIAPIFQVDNLPRAIEFYREVFGFDVGWSAGDPPRIASVCRDHVEINLIRVERGEALRPSHVYIRMAGVDEFYAQALAARVRVKHALEDRDYGMRDCRLVDPDGNEISFGSEIAR
jgi:catechol 2,3-dioxygenase-like lactoylglutathione lyase family enzyme